MSLIHQFPEHKCVDYEKLIITPEGEYSMTKRSDGKKILHKILSIVGSTDKHVTDLTGNVGSDTILFALYFKKVDTIEYKQDNFNALQNNITVYNLPNINLHFGDSTILYNWKTDILYIDPPWGGSDYKLKEKLDLYLSDIRLDIYIQQIIESNFKPSFIFLKLPRNYNFDRFKFLNNIKKVHTFNIRGFNLVGLEINV